MSSSSSDHDGLFLAPAPPAGPIRDSILALLLTGRADPCSPAIDSFLDYVHQQRLDLSHLWAAYQNNTPIAAALALACAGKTAMVWTHPLIQASQIPIASKLLRALLQSLKPQQIHLVQTLLESSQKHAAQAFLNADFSSLATLIYMQAPSHLLANPIPTSTANPATSAFSTCIPGLPPHIQVFHWHESLRDRFAQTINATYEQTLDCPALRGCRDIHDIIETHMAVGQFNPQFWFLLESHNQPVGVILLNPLQEQSALELVYLGITPAWRQQGLSKILLRYALHLTAQQGLTQLLCAVDQQNTPALHLYQHAGFVATGKKTAFIRLLS